MDVSDNPMGTVHFGPAYDGEDYTLTDDPRYVTEDFKMSRDEYGDNTNDTSEFYEFPVVPQENLKPSTQQTHEYANWNEHLKISKDPHCASKDRVTSQKQPYTSLNPKSVQTFPYSSLAFNRNSPTPNARSTAKYENSTNTTNKYDTPKKVVPQKKPSTQQTHEYANWNVIGQQHGEGDQRSVDRKPSNKIPSTSGPGVKEVGKETTAPRKSQAFALDVTMPTKNENVSDMHHLMLPNPVMTGSPLNASPIPPKAKKRSFLPRKALPEQSVDTEQPPPGPSVTELRKIIEEKYSVN